MDSIRKHCLSFGVANVNKKQRVPTVLTPMKKLLFYLQNRQSQISVGLLFALSVAAVVYIYPRESKFKYEFSQGRPWAYENLVAPFDFAIQKTRDELQQEREAIRAQKTLLLVSRPEVGEQALEAFRQKCRAAFQASRDSLNLQPADEQKAQEEQWLRKGEELLGEVFDKGILKPSDNPLFESYGQVLLRRGKVSKPVDIQQFYSIKKADGFIRQALADSAVLPLRRMLLAQLDYNIFYDEDATLNFLQNELNGVLPTRGAVEKGELIIIRGALVDQEKYARLRSLKMMYESSLNGTQSYYLILSGQILLVSILFLVLYLFMYQFRSELMEDISRVTFILVNVLLMIVVAHFVARYNAEFIYLVPFSILPIVLRSFFDTRIALFVHMVAMLLIGFHLPNSFEFILLQFVAGIFAIILVNNLYKRSQLFITVAKIVLVYSVSYFSLAIIQEGTLNNINYYVFGHFFANGLLTLISFPLIYLQEKIFGFVSDVSLLELSDINNPLLRELSRKAPGTFQHSLQVANLAEEATLQLQGNALLVRTGALYHDIGKMVQPMYFIENQSGVNPHDELSFKESAEIIISHVKQGIILAKKHRLPDQIVDFIRTHHGSSTVMYFYKQYIKNYPKNEVDLKDFKYPGPRPFSKETALLMMADSVEAASRSLDNPDQESIDKLVEGIIDHQIREGQFENSAITLREIKQAKKVFKKMLMNIYHVRIKYPD